MKSGMHKKFLVTAFLLGALSVALGAFGAHSLKKITGMTPDTIASFEIGVRYQFYHTLALLAVAILYKEFQSRFLQWAGYFFIAGIVLFSGSLYVLTFSKATHMVGMNGIGIITPFGGLFFIAGWLLMLTAVVKK
jgi:uncharacterized membrane protein YgdD (TMEM256/DUF423 family)